jgi:hypothetical protein
MFPRTQVTTDDLFEYNNKYRRQASGMRMLSEGGRGQMRRMTKLQATASKRSGASK